MSVESIFSKSIYPVRRRRIYNSHKNPVFIYQMRFRKAEIVDNLELFVGETIKFESLRQPVVPPYLMLMPFIETPDKIIVENQYALDEEGFHGCIYQLKAEKACKGQIIIGFRDMQTGETTHRKEIPVIVG